MCVWGLEMSQFWWEALTHVAKCLLSSSFSGTLNLVGAKGDVAWASAASPGVGCLSTSWGQMICDA